MRTAGCNGKVGILAGVMVVLMLAGVEARAQRSVPMSKQPTAKPRLALRIFPSKLKPYGKASARTTRPTQRLGSTKTAAVERLASLQLKNAEGLVRKAYAPGVSRSQRAALLERARKGFGKWEGQVKRLIRSRAFSSPVYQEWVKKTWEANLVQSHAAVAHSNPGVDPARAPVGSGRAGTMNTMLQRLHGLSPRQMKQAVGKAWKGLYGGARLKGEQNVLKHNPLMLLPYQLDGAAAAGKVKTVAYRPERRILAPKTWRRRTYQIRTDVAFVWAPGVARTYTEFVDQKRTLLENGVLALHAKTGSWKNPFANAYDLAAAVNQARKATGNPNVKVVLVGYSQGNSNTYAFMQAQGRNPKERAMFAELRKNVVQIHDLNSAARGTPVADLGVEMVKILTGRGANLKDADSTLKRAGQFFDVRSNRVKRTVAAWVMKNRGVIGKGLRKLAGRGGGKGPLARMRRKVSDSIHNMLVGSLESLSTKRGTELMTNRRLQRTMASLPVLNTVGTVPKSRPELVPTEEPLDQRPGWKYLLQKGLTNDYQVPEQHQRLNPVLKGAVDLPTQAIGHWGITGVPIKGVHGRSHHSQFSPEVHTLNMWKMVQRMGLAE